MTTVPDITIKAGGVKNDETAKLSNDEIEKRNKKQKELEQLFTDANTAIEAGNLDEAITKLTQMTTEMPKCAACFAKLGDIYVKKNDLTNAEPAYLKAIEIDPTQAGVVQRARVGLQHAEEVRRRRQDEREGERAARARAPAAATRTPSTTRASSSGTRARSPKPRRSSRRPSSSIRRWPTRSTGYGMALVNEGKLPDAKKPFTEYLKLAPTGQYADTAKAMLAMIK